MCTVYIILYVIYNTSEAWFLQKTYPVNLSRFSSEDKIFKVILMQCGKYTYENLYILLNMF